MTLAAAEWSCFLHLLQPVLENPEEPWAVTGGTAPAQRRLCLVWEGKWPPGPAGEELPLASTTKDELLH